MKESTHAERFALSTEQLELLLSFEKHASLLTLASVLLRDQSVISRNLQKLAETAPVIVKQKGRWQITPLGRQINEVSRKYLAELNLLTTPVLEKKKLSAYSSPKSALIIINAQMALLDPAQGSRNNALAENNIAKILADYRNTNKAIIHIKHVSDNPASAFYHEASGSKFLPALAPLGDEKVIEKRKSSGFTDTHLAEFLSKENLDPLIITGFTANECIDATAREASELGFCPYVVGDATASFDFIGLDGRLEKADRIHRLVLANLNALFAKVIQTQDLLLF